MAVLGNKFASKEENEQALNNEETGGKLLSREETIALLKDTLTKHPEQRKNLGMMLALYPEADPQKANDAEKDDDAEWQKELAEADKAYEKWKADPWYDPDMEEYYKQDDGYEG